MAEQKEYVMIARVHYASKKGAAGSAKGYDPDSGKVVDGDMVKLAVGDVCPPHLVEVMVKTGRAALKGSRAAVLSEPNFHKGVRVGQPGSVGTKENLPNADEDGDDEGDGKGNGYPASKKGR